MLIFNPFPTTPFEEYFRNATSAKKPIYCVNIHKNMAEYIRRRLKKKKITESFIYPSITNNAKNALNTYLDDITKLRLRYYTSSVKTVTASLLETPIHITNLPAKTANSESR